MLAHVRNQGKHRPGPVEVEKTTSCVLKSSSVVYPTRVEIRPKWMGLTRHTHWKILVSTARYIYQYMKYSVCRQKRLPCTCAAGLLSPSYPRPNSRPANAVKSAVETEATCLVCRMEMNAGVLAVPRRPALNSTDLASTATRNVQGTAQRDAVDVGQCKSSKKLVSL